jgi:2-hydroxychromene-2-carboxylate isomerase
MEQDQCYFDVISPFSYLHWHRLGPLKERLNIRPISVLRPQERQTRP